METLDRLFREHAFFQDMDPKHLDILVGCASNVRFAEGEFLFREGEEAKSFFFVRAGLVALEVFVPGKGAMKVETVGDGGVIGWSWLVPPYRWHFDGRAVQPTRALALDAVCLRNKCEQDHDLGYAILKRFFHIVQQRLAATRVQLIGEYSERK
jgi:CRP/FNR family cyclic AMP-dependent transcriptional regulator